MDDFPKWVICAYEGISLLTYIVSEPGRSSQRLVRFGRLCGSVTPVLVFCTKGCMGTIATRSLIRSIFLGI